MNIALVHAHLGSPVTSAVSGVCWRSESTDNLIGPGEWEGGTLLNAGPHAVNGLMKWTCGLAIPADINADGHVNVDALLALIGAWSACPPGTCPADVNGSGVVDVDHLLLVLSNWG